MNLKACLKLHLFNEGFSPFLSECRLEKRRKKCSVKKYGIWDFGFYSQVMDN